ncbi:MAG: gamma-glutamyl-gamma-aminobutyrate hydrolase family protein [Acidobacteriota bacterium]|nr:gamma-glutamyl-gamma-aminobutyrate hydrolase family protein [Acidobacteriota bacterium]
MRTVFVLQHAACETLGTIAAALERAHVRAVYIRAFAGDPIPEHMGEAVGLILMGGPMGVYEQDRYPFLTEEIRLIEHALAVGKPILGACLGSQLLAAALGARVRKGLQKEIGWFPITLTEAARTDELFASAPPSFIAYHWHGDVFDCPSGAVSLARSELTECQAFRYGTNAYGLLFHLEVTEPIIAEMVRTFAEELREAGLSGEEIVRQAAQHLPELERIGHAVFRAWTRLIEA